MDDLTIERVTAQNPGDVVQLIEEYYEAIGVVARDDHNTLLRVLADAGHAAWVAYAHGEAAGCILLRPLPNHPPSAEIKRLYVRPFYRGRRIAGLLLDTLERFARSRNIAWLYLDTKDDLHEAIAFYRRNGYTPCDRYNDNPQATIFLRKQLPAIVLRSFQAGDEEAFRSLNEAWITKYFHMEGKDRETLSDPRTYILEPGGHIFMAVRDSEPVGCCALLRLSDGSFEIAKMAVKETERGGGIGRLLLEHAIAFAKTHSVKRLYLETNSSLANAIHLYESVGFRRLSSDRVTPSPYVRVDVCMELALDRSE